MADFCDVFAFGDWYLLHLIDPILIVVHFEVVVSYEEIALCVVACGVNEVFDGHSEMWVSVKG